jgi:hypothetical protein
LTAAGARISIDQGERGMHNNLIERLWRSSKNNGLYRRDRMRLRHRRATGAWIPFYRWRSTVLPRRSETRSGACASKASSNRVDSSPSFACPLLD